MKLRVVFAALAVALLVVGTLAVAPVSAKTDGYTVDKDHSSVTFRIKHLNIGYVHGRWNDFSGAFMLDEANPAASSVTFEVKAASVDTNAAKRDDHLRGPDFFNVAQFPTIAFKSTSVKRADDKSFDVTGDLTMHGVTKPVTVRMEKVGAGKDPWGNERMGFEGTVVVQRLPFGIAYMPEGLSDDVRLTIAIEGIKQK